ncbi:MAG: UMP kinase [Pseudomonadota bacterium]
MPADTESEPSKPLQYKRVLLKLSGEALMGDDAFGINMPTCAKFATEIADAHKAGAEICIVIGGGNIFRGLKGTAIGMERAQADYMGMLATVFNALAMQNALEQQGIETRVQSGIEMQKVCEPFIRRRALRHLEKGRVVIFAAGLGSPYFTTDTAAALRAAEMNCEAMLKGTQVDGVYSEDPKLNPEAERFDAVSYDDVLSKNLKVMDASAVSLMRDTDIPIVVFSLHSKGALHKVLTGQGPKTVISA